MLSLSALGQIQTGSKIEGNILPGEKKSLQVVYDKTSDYSEITSKWLSIEGKQVFPGMSPQITFAANLRFAGREIKSPADEFGLLFNYSARSWMFSLHHRLIFQVDGETIDFGDGNYSTKPGMTGATAKPGVLESMRFTANREQIEKIINGKQVEFQLSAITGSLTDEHKQTLREILNLSNGK